MIVNKSRVADVRDQLGSRGCVISRVCCYPNNNIAGQNNVDGNEEFYVTRCLLMIRGDFFSFRKIEFDSWGTINARVVYASVLLR